MDLYLPLDNFKVTKTSREPKVASRVSLIWGNTDEKKNKLAKNAWKFSRKDSNYTHRISQSNSLTDGLDKGTNK